MADLISISRSDEWELVYDDQDIRGWTVYDASGNAVGEVDDMLANPEVERIEYIVLKDGTRYPARDISIGDEAIHLAREATSSKTSVYGEVPVRGATETGPLSYASYDQDFRTYHDDTYGTDTDYQLYESAYRYGLMYGADTRYAGRDWDAVEPELRRRYEARHGDNTWNDVKNAIRHAFDYGQRHAHTTTTHI